MNLGLLSDTHGRNDLVEIVKNLFQEEGLDAIIHAGDVTRVTHLQPLLELGIPLHMVYGNCDFKTQSFEQAERSTSLIVHGTADIIHFDGRTVGVTHGHFNRHMTELREANPDYIVHGHTHERRDKTRDSIHYLNPGSVKPPNSSVAVLQTERNQVTFLDVPDT